MNHCEDESHEDKVEAVVGLGMPVRWLCQEHWEAAMVELGERLRQLREITYER